MWRISDSARAVKLTKKDRRILTELSYDCRIPITVLCRKVMMSRDSCAYRIKRMQDKGVILRFVPEIDFSRIGLNPYFVFFLLDERDQDKQKEIISHLRRHKNVTSIIEYSDQWDIEVAFVAKSLEEFDSMLSDILLRFSSVILEKAKLASIRRYYSTILPYVFYRSDGLNNNKPVDIIPAKHDEKDLRIVRHLSLDCRASTYELGRAVKMSADSVGIRLRKMRQSGLIRAFSLAPCYSSLGYNLYTFAVKMSYLDPEYESKFSSYVHDHPNIISAVKTIGDWDLLIRIIADDSRRFHRVVKEIKREFSGIIKNYATFDAFREQQFVAFPEAAENTWN
jgi:Lrp/AsnC family transcriptional regulator for asnA, asnC and gidA